MILSQFHPLNSIPVLAKENEAVTSFIPLTAGEDITIHVINQEDVDISQQTIELFEESSLLITVDKSVWQDILQENELFIDFNENYLETHIDVLPVVVDISETNKWNCDPLQRGVIETKITLSGYTFISDQHGVSCNWVELPETSTNHSYLIRFIGENRAGRSIKYSLFHSQLRKDVLDELLPKHSFDSSYITYPFSSTQNAIFTLHWENRSFGQISENSIEKIFQYELPTMYLGLLHFVPNKRSQPHIINNTTEIKSTTKYGRFLYSAKVETKSSEKKSGLLVLSQTYDSGWLAFKTNKPLSPALISHPMYNW